MPDGDVWYHELMRTDERQRYRCEACGEEFKTESALRTHVRAVGLVD